MVGRHRAAEIEPLPFAALLRAKERVLFQRLDALGDDAVSEAPAHADHRAHDRRPAGGRRDLMDERLINLEDIDRKLPQIGHARVTGPEVIDRDGHAECPQRLQHFHRRRGLSHEDALGQLELEIPRVEAGVAEHLGRMFQKVLRPQLDGGHVHRHGHREP